MTVSVTVSVTDNITIVTQQHEDPAPAPARLYQQGIDPDLDVPSSMNFCVEWSREPALGAGEARTAGVPSISTLLPARPKISIAQPQPGT